MMESLDPIPPAERTWNWVSFALLWVAMTINPMGMVLGSSLVDLGLGVGVDARQGALAHAVEQALQEAGPAHAAGQDGEPSHAPTVPHGGHVNPPGVGALDQYHCSA